MGKTLHQMSNLTTPCQRARRDTQNWVLLTQTGVRTTKLCLSEDCNMVGLDLDQVGHQATPRGIGRSGLVSNGPPNIVHSLYTQWRTQGKPCSPQRNKWRVRWCQPKVWRPYPVSSTSPIYSTKEETHSGGIPHVDPRMVHINWWDGVRVASPMDPWAHPTKPNEVQFDWTPSH